MRYDQDKGLQTRLLAYICVTALLAEPGACLGPTQTSALADSLKTPLQDLVMRFRCEGGWLTPGCTCCPAVQARPQPAPPACECPLSLAQLRARHTTAKSAPVAPPTLAALHLYASPACREVGATCSSAAAKPEHEVKEEPGVPGKGGAKGARSASVVLLPDPQKTLGQALPGVKRGAAKKK